MAARIALWVVAGLWILGGVIGDMKAQNAIHQILAQMDYLIGAIFIIGAEIVGAVYSSKKDPNTRAEPRTRAVAL